EDPALILSPGSSRLLVLCILILHLGIIVFNIGGLIVIPWGGVRGWSWVRNFWLRLAHLVALSVVAIQALLGRACFLTIWQAELSTRAEARGHTPPLIAHWINQLIFWPIPLWVFTLLYIVVWVYTVALWWRFPPRAPFGPSRL
ncbi:hypothetical protein B1B_01979, partial [mine drainage metagenome]